MGEPVVVFATNVLWDGIWYGAQHLGSRLAHRGFRVLFLELPMTVASPLRHPVRARELLGRRLRELGPTLAVDLPLGLPPQEHPRMRGVNARLLARRVRHDLRRLAWPDPDFLLIRHRLGWRLAAGFPTARVVANLSDAVYFADDDGRDERASLLASAEAAVCVSPPLVAEAAEAGIRDRLLLPQGVDFATIDRAAARGPAPDLAGVGQPRIGFVGHVTPRIDFDLVEEVASARPAWQFVVVGDVHPLFEELRRHDPFRGRVNVHVLGLRDRADVGRYLAGFDAAWVPYTWSEFNVASNPLKIMDCLAAGLPVVAPAFPALVDNAADTALMPETAKAPDWVDALERALGDSADEARAARRAFAAANSWESRADRLASFLQDLGRSAAQDAG
ncbi:MAG: glycosyltransferase [Acidimicrobiia bacterium]|nr:glycosyltransferase [Acidimicrobiia bacterium]